MKKFFIAIITLSVFVTIFTSCSGNSADTQTTSSTIGFYKSGIETFEIDTPYAKLQYPTVWKDKCKIEKSETSPYTVIFYGIVGSENVRMFDIVFGTTSENSYKIGTLNVNGADLDVFVADYSAKWSESYALEDYPELYSMAEDVNEIISGLVYNYGLELA